MRRIKKMNVNRAKYSQKIYFNTKLTFGVQEYVYVKRNNNKI